MAIAEKKLNLGDPTIQIRILKALEDVRPFGLFKNFYMIKIVRNLKQPNVIQAKHIWQYIEAEYDMKKLDEKASNQLKIQMQTFDAVFDV